MKYSFAISFLVLAAISSVSGYSAGAPEEVCDTMIPGHPVDPQPSAFPYTVTVSHPEIKSGAKLQIKISAGTEKTFKGFFVQVRNGKNSVGSFIVSDTDKFIKTVACHSNGKSGATHKNGTIKKVVDLDWVAPKDYKGKLDVYVTVAKDGEVFWVGKKQAELKITN